MEKHKSAATITADSLPMDFWIQIELLSKPEDIDSLRGIASIVRVAMSRELKQMPEHWVRRRRRLSDQIQYVEAIGQALDVLYVAYGGTPF